jgi:glycosyltransferase involved in cell wall biosynthesis
MAVVRGHRANVGELASYAEVLREFDVTYFFTGRTPAECRRDLNDLGLERVAAYRYRSYTDLVSLGPLGPLVDFKLGFASWMLSGVREALAHDVINVVDPIYRFASQLARAMRPEQKLVVVRWEIIPNRYADVLGGRARAARVLARADGIVCATDAARQSLVLGSAAAARVEVIHPGVRMPAQAAAPVVEPEPRIVTVARLQWQKGLDDLIAAVALLRRCHGVPARLTVIGGGNDGPWRRLVRSYDLGEDVEFTGALPAAEVRRRLAQAAVYCQPSATSRTWCEQFGFAVVEAMAGGRPVVTCATGVLPEIVGPDGVYAPARNAAGLAQALADVLRDPRAAADRGRRLQARARERYDAARQGTALLDFFRAL